MGEVVIWSLVGVVGWSLVRVDDWPAEEVAGWLFVVFFSNDCCSNKGIG